MTLKDTGLAERLAHTKVIAFDVDGTLTDSIEQIVKCFQRTFARANLPIPTPKAIHGTIGLSLPVGIQSLLPDPSDEKYALTITELYRQCFIESEDLHATILFDGVLDLLTTLAGRNYKLAIASGKSKVGVNRVLHDIPELQKLITMVCTGDVYPSKPQPDMMHAIMQHYGCSASEVMGMGDALLDIAMFRNAKCSEVGVLSGVCSFDDFLAQETEFILPKATALLCYL